MRIRYCIISALTISLIASAPLNASAEALNDSFCSAEEIDEDIDNVNTYDEDLNDDFISNGSVEDTEVFSSQMEAYSTEEDDSTTDGWTPLKKEPKISFKYDSETQTLSFKASNHVLYQILCQMELEVIGISLIRKLEMRQQL